MPNKQGDEIDWSQLRNRDIPGINLKLKPDEYAKLARLATEMGTTVSEVARELVKTVLPFAETREVLEPRIKLALNLTKNQGGKS